MEMTRVNQEIWDKESVVCKMEYVYAFKILFKKGNPATCTKTNEPIRQYAK